MSSSSKRAEKGALDFFGSMAEPTTPDVNPTTVPTDEALEPISTVAMSPPENETPVSAETSEAPPAGVTTPEASTRDRGNKRGSILRELKIDDLVCDPDQVRQDEKNKESGLDSLAASIRLHGLVAPIVVRRGEGASWVIVAGERRYLAAKMAGLTTVPTLERVVIDESFRLQLQLVENLLRKDLTVADRKRGYLKLREECGSSSEAARLLGIDRRSFLRVVEEKPVGVPLAVARLSFGQFTQSFDKWIPAVEKLTEERREVLIRQAERLLEALRARS